MLAHLSGDADADRGVPARRRHPRPDRAQGLRRRQRARPARTAAAGEDHQLRAALREDGVHAGQGHRRHAAGGAGVHRRLLRRLSRGPRVHRPAARRGPADRRREDAVRPAPPGAGADEPQRPGAGGGRARVGQHADPGHGGRHPEARDDRRPPRARGAARARRAGADDPDGARRTAVRGAPGRGRRGGGAGAPGHGRRGAR